MRSFRVFWCFRGYSGSAASGDCFSGLPARSRPGGRHEHQWSKRVSVRSRRARGDGWLCSGGSSDGVRHRSVAVPCPPSRAPAKEFKCRVGSPCRRFRVPGRVRVRPVFAQALAATGSLRPAAAFFSTARKTAIQPQSAATALVHEASMRLGPLTEVHIPLLPRSMIAFPALRRVLDQETL